MISKSLYFKIIVRVVIITALSVGMSFSLNSEHPFYLTSICLAGIIIATVNLIWFLNATNRKLTFFFEAVRNNDSTLQFPKRTGNKTEEILNSNLNEVNNQIQQLKIEIQQKENYFQTMLENVATGVITYNSKGFVLHANSAAKKMLSLEVLTHLKQLEKVDVKLYNTIQRIKPMEHSLVSISNENTETELAINATPFKSKEDELVILSIQDIKNELDAKELNSWIKLIRVLMHEIMNTITPITSLSESLYKRVAKLNQPIDSSTNEIVCQGLEVIKNQSSSLMNFVESYRKLTKLPRPEKKNFKIADLINRVKLLFEADNKTIFIYTETQPNDLEINADENQISQVLINLVKNALQANKDNPDAKIWISAKIAKNRPVVEVTDNGPGIPREIIDEIFVPFFTTNENGTGIGLSISKQIVALHGGTLKVKSAPNKETSFTIEF
ncbi:MAG: histidine kinase [Bacteroidales bacterium]|nr:histidine kinase [Bacteroidales bacterium]